MRKSVITIAFALAACSTTPDDLSEKAEASVRDYDLNYQELYRRVSSNARRCWVSVFYSASSQVDAELYPDLGYAEVTHSLAGAFGRNYYTRIRIDRLDDDRSRMTVNTGNTLSSGKAKAAVFRWADGSGSC